jgi:hypothetical protein
MSEIPWHCSRRDRNDFRVNLAVMKMGLKKIKTSTMLIPWHYDDNVVDDVTWRQRHQRGTCKTKPRRGAASGVTEFSIF